MDNQSQSSLNADSASELLVAGLFDYAPLNSGKQEDIWQALGRAFAVADEITWPLIGNDISLAVENVALINNQALAKHRLPVDRELFICAQGSILGGRLSSISQTRFDELNLIQMFNQQNLAGHSPLRVTSYEFMLSAEAQADTSGLKVGLRNIVAFLFEDNIRVCIEPEILDDSWIETLPALCEVAGDVSQRVAGPALFLKLNLDAGSPLETREVAQVIVHAAASGINLKFCAASLPLFSEISRKRLVPGLINLSLAHCLCHDPESENIEPAEICACLECSDPAAFYLDQIAAWGNYRLDLNKLAGLRETCPLSIEIPDLVKIDTLLTKEFGARA